MLWHIVRFTFAEDTDSTDREQLEEALRGLADAIGEVRLLRVARDVDDERVTGLITGFDDADALAAYREHPDHVPVVARARELCADITRLDVVTHDPVDALARTGP